MPVPVIDLFAGPGGLGEGFSQVDWKKKTPYFQIKLSVEKDFAAHRTLKLRSFLRQFPYGQEPPEYYEYLRAGRPPEELYEIKKYAPQAEAASYEAWCASLGSGVEFDRLLDAKIEKLINGREDWVLIGGPPCQAYSIMGRARNRGVKNYIPENDGRHFLYQEYLRIIARHKPAVFVMENVKGILSSNVNGGKIFEQIKNDLSNPLGENDCKYKVFSIVKKPDGFSVDGKPELKKEDFIIESEKYGLPQARHRVVLLGVRDDLCQDNFTPEVFEEENETVSVYKVLGLPRLRSGLSRGKYTDQDWKRAVLNFPMNAIRNEVSRLANGQVWEWLWKSIANFSVPKEDMGGEFVASLPRKILDQKLCQWLEDPKIQGVFNHSARTHMVSDLHRYLFAACFAKAFGRSPKMHEFPEILKPDHKNRDTGHFEDRFRVQVSGNPSSTITSHISKDGHYYIHYDPSQCRSLTVREAARLQTFPDNYYFCGNRTEQYVQVGNAVPPLLAYKIAKIVKNILIEVKLIQRNSDRHHYLENDLFVA